MSALSVSEATFPTKTVSGKILRLLMTCLRMAGTTRLELATSAVTGQRSNQLNYVPNLLFMR